MSEEPQKNRFAALSDFGGGEAENDFAADMRRIMEANNTQKQADTLGAVSNGAGDDESYLEKDIDIDALISSFDTIGLKAGVDFGMDELLSELRVVGQQVREEQKAELEKAMTRNFKENNGEASENSDASKFQQAIADYYQKKHSLSGKQLFHMRRKMARRRRQARQRGQNYNDRRRTRAYGRQSRLKARRRARY